MDVLDEVEYERLHFPILDVVDCNTQERYNVRGRPPINAYVKASVVCLVISKVSYKV